MAHTNFSRCEHCCVHCVGWSRRRRRRTVFNHIYLLRWCPGPRYLPLLYPCVPYLPLLFQGVSASGLPTKSISLIHHPDIAIDSCKSEYFCLDQFYHVTSQPLLGLLFRHITQTTSQTRCTNWIDDFFNTTTVFQPSLVLLFHFNARSGILNKRTVFIGIVSIIKIHVPIAPRPTPIQQWEKPNQHGHTQDKSHGGWCTNGVRPFARPIGRQFTFWTQPITKTCSCSDKSHCIKQGCGGSTN